MKGVAFVFLQGKTPDRPLNNDDQPLEVVTSHEVLGLIIYNELITMNILHH